MDIEKIEKYVVLNKNDRALRPFHFYLPKRPKKDLIDGFHKQTEKQVFERVKYPAKLKAVEKEARDYVEETKKKGSTFSMQKVIARIWEILSEDRVKYKEEISWIKKQIYHVRHGYWFWNEGVATYISGFHYAYLNFWTVDDVKEVEYRERDREWFLLVDYILKNTKNADGIDMGSRTLMGLLYPKNRRDGATHRSLCVVYFLAIYTSGLNLGGIQSLDESSGAKQFKKLTKSFKGMPFFFKPQWSGSSEEPESKLNFKTNSYLGHLPSLDNYINYATTSNRSFYDGDKLIAILIDEAGKTIGERVDERHDVLKKCVVVGEQIHGIMLYPSTTAQMEAENGQLFKNLAYQSMFHDRDTVTGQTVSGLVTIFYPSCYGFYGYIDKFGKAVVEDPLEKDKWRLKSIHRDANGKLLGARRAIIQKRNYILESGGEDANEKYITETKLTPMEFLESFAGGEGGVGFNSYDIKQRMTDIEYEEDNGTVTGVYGNFVWDIDGKYITAKEFIELGLHLVRGSTDRARVEFIPSGGKEDRFFISKHPQSSNRKMKIDNIWFPITNNEHIASADSFSMLKKNETAKKKAGYSLGAGTVFERTTREDMPKNVSEYKSHKFVCDYLFRTSALEEYLEEMLMMCIYYGTRIYPENNIQSIEDYFIKRGYKGYLLYELTPNGKFKDRAGFFSNREKEETITSRLKTYFAHHVKRENHVRILSQALDFRGIESYTRLDSLISAGGCLLGDIELSKYEIFNDNEEEEAKKTKEKMYDEYNY